MRFLGSRRKSTAPTTIAKDDFKPAVVCERVLIYDWLRSPIAHPQTVHPCQRTGDAGDCESSRRFADRQADFNVLIPLDSLSNYRCELRDQRQARFLLITSIGSSDCFALALGASLRNSSCCSSSAQINFFRPSLFSPAAVKRRWLLAHPGVAKNPPLLIIQWLSAFSPLSSTQ